MMSDGTEPNWIYLRAKSEFVGMHCDWTDPTLEYFVTIEKPMIGLVEVCVHLGGRDFSGAISSRGRFSAPESLRTLLSNLCSRRPADADSVFVPKNDDTNAFWSAVEEVVGPIHATAIALKNYFNWSRIARNSLVNREFSIDDRNWKGVSHDDGDFQIVVSALHEVPINNDAMTLLKEYLQGNEPSLKIAMVHLHRALGEGDPRHRWIDATIAAELAIKEFLLLKAPELGPLLLEVPSPPLAKLYGSVLKAYAGVESPKRSKLINGVEVRNKLLHRPSGIDIDRQVADSYVADVEEAIMHLQSLLRPDDPVIRAIVKSCEVRGFRARLPAIPAQQSPLPEP